MPMPVVAARGEVGKSAESPSTSPLSSRSIRRNSLLVPLLDDTVREGVGDWEEDLEGERVIETVTLVERVRVLQEEVL